MNDLLVDDDLKTIDEKTVAQITAHCGYDPRFPRQRTETIRFETGERDFKGFISDLYAAYRDIPKEYRKSAYVEVSEGEFIDALTLSFKRPETSEEVRENIRSALFHVLRQQQKDQRDYARLKAKFEKNTP